MKRILINATHAEEIRVALCNGNHLYDFDLENRTREQKKANIYKGHVTRVEPSLEAVFVEYGSARQGFLPIREIASDYLAGDARAGNIKNLIKEGDELIIQIEKEERGNKGAALSTFVSLAGRYLVLMPNNPRGGGISRQISGKLRDEMKQILSNLHLPKGMSVIIRTAGIGKSSEDLQHDLDHLLTIWKGIQEQNKKYPSPRLVHQEAGVVTRAVRDYLRDDIAEIWVDNENAYNEAANFIEAVMPQQASKLRKYTDFEPMFARFGIEKQIETAYQREVRLPSGGSIVIDQTEALVSIDINSSKATKGADVSETAYNTNLEAAEEIARQLRLRDMGGLIVIDFIDMATSEHQKQVENRIREATKNDRARIQFAEISRFGLLEMSRQRLRPSLEEATGFLCPRCHGNGMIRDLRSLALSIMRQIEQKALLERQGEVQAEVPTEIAAFLLNEKRESLVYLEQDSGTRITILPHAHLESPNFTLTYNREGFAPTSYERISESEQSEIKDRGYDTNWHTEQDVIDSQARQTSHAQKPSSAWSNANAANTINNTNNVADSKKTTQHAPQAKSTTAQNSVPQANQGKTAQIETANMGVKPTSVAWLSNLFAPTQQASLADSLSSQDAAAAIENLVNAGAKSLGVYGQVSTVSSPSQTVPTSQTNPDDERRNRRSDNSRDGYNKDNRNDNRSDNRSSKDRRDRHEKSGKHFDEPKSDKSPNTPNNDTVASVGTNDTSTDNHIKNGYDKSAQRTEQKSALQKREPHSKRDSRGEKDRKSTLTPPTFATPNTATTHGVVPVAANAEEGITKTQSVKTDTAKVAITQPVEKSNDPHNVQMHVIPVVPSKTKIETIQLSLDASKVPQPIVQAETVTTRTSQTPSHSNPVQTTDVTHEVKVVVQQGSQKPTQPASQAIADTTATPKTPVEQTITETSIVKAGAMTSTPSSVAVTNDSRVDNLQNVEPVAVKKATSPLPMPIADIQVTAALPVIPQLGRAKNDPREVYKHLQQTAASPSMPVQAVVAQTAKQITGTVGQFIEQHLPDTLKDGVTVVNQFLEAMTIFGNKNTQIPESIATNIATTSENAPNFDEKFGQFFRNYGFEAVTQADIDQYHRLCLPSDHYECDAGTNHSQPTVPTQRASNDPRGQIVEQSTQPTANPNPEPPMDSTTYKAGSVGAWIVQQLGDMGASMMAQGSLITAFLQASHISQANHHSQSHQRDQNAANVIDTPIDAHALVSEAAVETVNHLADDMLHIDSTHQPSSESVQPTPPISHLSEEDIFKENLFKALTDTAEENHFEGDDDNSQKAKTTAASYKNMIESVAEQMSMGTSTILKLSTTKTVAKSRIRKEKTPDKVVIKAPTKPKTRTSKKVESAVVTKVVKKDPETSDLIPDNDDTLS